MLKFNHFYYTGVDAEKFLQGQLTVNVQKLNTEHYQACAICDLKGRIHFSLWIKRLNQEQFSIIISHDLADEFQTHIKKFGAFSKAQLAVGDSIYPSIEQEQSTFNPHLDQQVDLYLWQKNAILKGQAWITAKTSHLFQPQELRLHQRHGVDYDKGCYLGQEIIARLWFRSQPKHWLHLIQGIGTCPQDGQLLTQDIQIVNCLPDQESWLALVIAKPESLSMLEHIQILDLPENLNQPIGRNV